MTRQFDVDRLLEDWLAEGPSRLSDRALEGIVRQLDETPQRRRWSLPRGAGARGLAAALGAAAAAVVAFLAIGLNFNQSGFGGPPMTTPSPAPTASPSPAPTPTPEPEGKLFESERYGYSLRLPDDKWVVVERRGEWAPGTTFNQEGPGVDTLLRPVSVDYPFEVYLNSQPLPEGKTFDEWLSEYDELQTEAFAHCVRQGDFGSAPVDGETARLGTYLCDEDDDQWFVTESLWQHGQRVHTLRVAEGPESSLELDTTAEAELWLSRITHTD